jgi:alanyl aminopeptidase
VRPVRYALDLTVRPEEPAFEGIVRIDLDFRERTTVFWLNSRNLSIHSAQLNAEGSILPLRVLSGDGETVGFSSPTPIPSGSAQLVIRYTGQLDKDSNDGPFRRLLGNDWYVFTTFTPIEARRAFPCFDEPRFKTPWQLTLHVKRDNVALGNAPQESEADEPDGMKKVVFAPTARLASEVVAFAVGPFDVVDAGRAGKKQIPVRIITPRGRSADAAAARSATPEILSRLEEYTGIPYPWAKLDHLALVQGAFGAVENPGLITYQEGILLASVGRDTLERQQQMRSTMAHELAHQWFGNLVTQSTWTDVWLSEGFATWLSAKIMDVEYPSFERPVADNLRLRAMSLERADRPWPVRRPITSRKDATTVYNGLVYQKAAAVLDTLESWLGEDPMQRGLQKYLTDHAFGVATADDVASALEAASGIDVAPVLHSLLDRPGVPVVTAQLDCKRLTVDAGGWTLPLCSHWDDGGRQCVVVHPGTKEISLDAASCPTWIWTNASGRGYYRSRLPVADFEAILSSGYRQLDTSERRTLIADAGSAVLSGHLPAAALMKLLAASARDQEPRVSLEALRIATSLGEVVPVSERAAYARWMQQTFGVTPPAPKQSLSISEFLKGWEAARRKPAQ